MGALDLFLGLPSSGSMFKHILCAIPRFFCQIFQAFGNTEHCDGESRSDGAEARLFFESKIKKAFL
jgi:hypothetical protein